MIKTGFNGTSNGIGTYCSIINQISVVFSVVFYNIIKYDMIKHVAMALSVVFEHTVQQ